MYVLHTSMSCCPLGLSSYSLILSQQLQMSRNAVHHALRPQNPQHSPTAASNLRATSVLDHPRAESKTDGLRLQQL